ncbi:hypothetical protein ACFLYU_03050 [Candidatus Dependentiae bacterium]
MNKKQGIATYWLIVMITILKLFSIVFLCSLNIDIEKLLVSKYKGYIRTSPFIYLRN